jgi:hypothetical protein
MEKISIVYHKPFKYNELSQYHKNHLIDFNLDKTPPDNKIDVVLLNYSSNLPKIWMYHFFWADEPCGIVWDTSDQVLALLNDGESEICIDNAEWASFLKIFNKWYQKLITYEPSKIKK